MSKDINHKVKSTKDTAEKQNSRQDILLASLKNKEIRRRLGDLSLAVKTIRKWLKNSTHGKTFSIELTHSVSQMIKGVMGRDFDSHSITANSIIHSLKGHGVDGTKLNEKSIPLRKSDMELIPYIMIAPDYLAKGSVDGYGRESIRFFKALSNGVVVVVEKEYKNSPDDMETITMWAEKSSGARNARQNAAPAENVQDAIPDTDIAKIHKDAEIAIKNDVNFSYDIAVEQLAKVSKGKNLTLDKDKSSTITVDNVVIREPLTRIVEPNKNRQKTLKNCSKLERSINNQISTTMSKTKKQPVKQVKAAQGKQDAEPVEKTANESVKNEESKAEKQHRLPQMVTVNGQKVTHAHAFRSNTNPEDMWFTAKIDGKDLKARKMSAEDVKAYHDKTITVEQLMQKYYPTKLLPKVSKEDFKAANVLSDGRTIEKFTVYKEDNEKSRDYGKYRMYAKVGNRQYRKTLSQADLDRFYDHVTTPKELVESNLGEVLNLASAYEKYKLPEGEKVENINVRKNAEGKWLISANLGVKGQTAEHELNQSDLYSLFNAKTASKEQLAAKYLTSDIKNAKAQTEQQKQSKSNSMKI